MPDLKLTVLSLRYSSWSMRAWLTLTQAGADFALQTASLPDMQRQGDCESGALAELRPADRVARRQVGSVTGLFPTLWIDGQPVHETLAICETVADLYPDAGLWPGAVTDRARARAVSTEMATGFTALRGELSCHLFGRVPGFAPSAAAAANIDRIFELWAECLDRSGGPFLFGQFGIADAMYFPVLSRLRTYNIALPEALVEWAHAMDSAPPVQALWEAARQAPAIAIYDDYLRELGGDPAAATPKQAP
jgi:glutathione S-transferase